jgi:hypothetical protein
MCFEGLRKTTQTLRQGNGLRVDIRTRDLQSKEEDFIVAFS